jgi:hypothetical protein
MSALFLRRTSLHTITQSQRSWTEVIGLWIDIFGWCSCGLAVARWILLIEQELRTYPEYIRSVFTGVRVVQSLIFDVLFCKSLFVLLSFFLFAIVLSILLYFRLLITLWYFLVFHSKDLWTYVFEKGQCENDVLTFTYVT